MRFLSAILLCLMFGASTTFAAVPSGSARALAEGKKAFAALCEDAKRGALRDSWLQLAERFLALSKKNSGQIKAEADFYQARAREELGRRSFNAADHKEAVRLYTQVARVHTRYPVAPQSLYRQATILAYRLENATEARAAAALLLKSYPKAQDAAAARKLLNELDGKKAEATGPATALNPASKKSTATRDAGGGRAAKNVASGGKGTAKSGQREPDGKDAASGKRRASTGESGAAREKDTGTAPGSLMEQLGLTVQTIMLDPGHGGKDPGAMVGGFVERDFTLAMGRRVGELLRRQGFTVLYTRNKNSFVSLQARPDIANSKKADLFLSLHMNSNPSPSIGGLEIYYLDMAKSSDAAKVAARENAVSVKNISDLQYILTDLMLSAKLEESRDLAGCVRRGVLQSLRAAKLPARDHGVRSAPFYVLMGARMPAILVEFGYASNPEDAALLKSEAFLQRQAQGLVDGILAYKAKLAKFVPKK